MKHVQTYTLFESAAKRDFMGELKHALYETQTGKDLLAIAKVGGMASESLTTWARFESEIGYMGGRRTADVQTVYKGKGGRQGAVGDPIMWSWGYNPVGEWVQAISMVEIL